MTYFTPVKEYEHVLIKCNGKNSFTYLGLYINPDEEVSWVTNWKQQHMTKTHTKLSELKQSDVDRILADIIGIKFKEEISPEKAHEMNRNLAERIFQDIHVNQQQP